MKRPLVALFIVGLGCRPATLPDPVVDAVEPPFAYNGADETVSILGANFYPQIEVDAPRDEIDVNPTWRAWLVGPDDSDARTPFVGVSIVDDGELQGTVGEGLATGLYDIEVEGPGGRAAVGGGLFTVTDSVVAQLTLTPDRVVLPVTESVELDLAVVDLAGEVVPQPFDVALWVTDAAGDAVSAVTWTEGTLQDSEPSPDGDALFGSLEQGRATVQLAVAQPGTVQVELTPLEDSRVVADTIQLTFEPGSDLSLRLELPTDAGTDPAFVAGESFDLLATVVDELGNEVDTPTSVTLRTECSGWVSDDIELEGPTVVPVTPALATGAACDEDFVRSIDGPSGESPPYQVLPGPVDHFRVTAAPLQRAAGQEIDILIDPEDANGNRTPWSGDVTLTASTGGLLSPSCVAIGSVQVCTAMVTIAGGGVTIDALGDDGTTGTSNPFTVVADDEPVDVAVTVAGTPEAGIEHTVEITARDAWGNEIDAAVLGDAYTVRDELGEASCALSSATATTSRYGCVFETARVGATVTAEVVSNGVDGTSAPFEVVNGPLAEVRIEGEQPIVAGDALPLTFRGLDAFGNPYLVQVDPDLELLDDTGTWSEPSATLGADGTVTVSGTLTRAGTTTVRASQGGIELGASDPIVVDPGPTDGLAVTIDAPWAWRGLAMPLSVEAVDVFGNRTSYSGTATVTSRNTASPAVMVALVNGIGVDTFTWSGVALTEFLDATTSDPLTGSSDEILVVEDCGASSPVTDLQFGGFPEAVTCYDEGTGTATVTGDLGGSTAYGPALARYGLAVVDGERVVDSAPVLSVDVTSTGVHDLLGLVADTSGCAAEVSATAWAGIDDGTPVGPIPLSTAAADIAVVDQVTVDVSGVVDCSRDPAAFQTVRLRTTHGALAGVTATGEGLELALDLNGDGAAGLTTSGGLESGTVEVHAWVPSGAAFGLLELPLVGDNVRPTVVAQAPSGQELASITTVQLTFSEPLLPTTVVPGNFSVTGPTATGIASATLLPGDQVVELVLTAPADGVAGQWTVVATSALRDAAGNLLSGDWSGLSADYVGAFGDVGGSVDPLTCPVTTPSGLTFRPDGDDGTGSDADHVLVEVDSAQAPAWWVIEVFDGPTLIRQDYVVPVGPVDLVGWDGRDRRGGVVDNGSWELRLRPEDGLGNRGTGCDIDVTVDNATGRIP